MGVGVFVGVGVGVFVGVGVGAAVGTVVGDGVGEEVGVGVGQSKEVVSPVEDGVSEIAQLLEPSGCLVIDWVADGTPTV